jgi:hypothetical protein
MASASVDGAIWTFARISVIVAMKEEPAAMLWFVVNAPPLWGFGKLLVTSVR